MVLADPQLTQAVSKILLRSERVGSVTELQNTYVDTGVLPQLDNDNNQIVYGRRGTGKSHVLQILGSSAATSPSTHYVYIDLRYLGSTQQATDPARAFSRRCVTLFKDFLIAIYEALLETATDPDRVGVTGQAIGKVEDFGMAITSLATRSTSRDVSLTRKASAGSKRALQIELSEKPSLKIDDATEDGGETTSSETYREVFEDSILFSDIRRSCEQAIKECGLQRLLILIDEWTALPQDIQPFFAEFIKSTFLPSRAITLKIATLEYRSRFSLAREGNTAIGFEIGGDISANLDLDDYYVYDRSPAGAAQTFQEILFKHVRAELPSAYIAQNDYLATADAFRRKLFTEAATFSELVRAAEGVVRDFISIFNRAYFLAQRAARINIDVRTVREAARQWYETDKSINLSEEQSQVLHRIMTEVIGNKKARSFLLERRYARHPMIESLFDYRVLHIVSKGYSDRDNPGLRYNIYALDYGTYVDLLQTQSQPELDLGIHDASQDRVVPFDDRRSIRRVIVPVNMLHALR